MRTSSEITVFSPLTATEWEAPRAAQGQKGWWRCPALAVPGAKLRGLWGVGRQPIPKELYRVKGGKVHWRGGLEPPPGIEAEVVFGRRLVRRRTVALGLMLGVFLGAYATRHYGDEVRSVEKKLASSGAAVLTQLLAQR